MPTKKLTARFVESVKGNGVERVDYRDSGCSGLELRVTASGAKSWSLLYRLEKGRGAKRRRMDLGKFPAVDLEAAHREATKLKGKIAGGADPASGQRRAGDTTVKTMGEAYIEQHAKANKRSWRGDELALKADVYPVLGDMRPADVRRADVQRVIDRVIARGSPVQANRVLALMGSLFGWAIGSYVETSPCHRLRKPTKEMARERVLSRPELRSLWDLIENGSKPDSEGRVQKLSIEHQIAVKLLLLLGQRRAEVLEAERSELDLDAALWVIPGARAKNGRAHRLPLPPEAVTLFRLALAHADEMHRKRALRFDDERPSPFVFPSPFGAGRKWGDAAIGANSINHSLKRVLAGSPISDATPHDFRRTMATYLAELGTPEIHISALLNHTRSGVTSKHYARYTYEAEKRAALLAWVKFVDETIEIKEQKSPKSM